MQHRRVSDLMTPNVVRVQRGTTFKEIVRLLAEYDITAVPVVDEEDRPLGVVSEADLLRRTPGRHGLAALLDPSCTHLAGTGAPTAEALMTSPALVARPGWSVVEAARMMEGHQVKRLPVVDDAGRLVGMVSRADLLRIFLRHDRAIREEIVEDVLTRTLGIAPSSVSVEVDDGRVTLSGTVERAGQIPAVRRLCAGVDGVVAVDDRLGYTVDDAGAVAADNR